MDRVTLSPYEMLCINKLSTDRNIPKREAGVLDRIICQQGSVAIDRIGLMGEWAVARRLGVRVYQATGTQGDGGVADLVYHGFTVQVKATTRSTGRMLFKLHEPFRADIAALVIVTEPVATIAGWTSQDNFLAHRQILNLGYGDTQVLSQQFLSPLSSVLRNLQS